MLLITMDLADSEGDMANLTKVVEDFLTHTGDFKEKTNLLRDCIRTCYLRRDLKYSRILSEGAFFKYFEKRHS